MTQPDREELAGRLDEHARRYERSALMAENRAKRRTDSFRAANERGQAKLFRSRAADMKAAAAALRQSPSVEEVARVIDPRSFEDLAYAMDRLPAEPRSKYFTDLARLSRDGVDSALAKAQAIDRLYRGSKE